MLMFAVSLCVFARVSYVYVRGEFVCVCARLICVCSLRSSQPRFENTRSSQPHFFLVCASNCALTVWVLGAVKMDVKKLS